MTEDLKNLVPPMPERTGTTETQALGEIISLPSDIQQAQAGGLQQVTIESVIDATRLRSTERDIVKIVARGVVQEMATKQEKLDKLHEENTQLRVKEARADERLRSGQLQSGGQLLMTSIGGSLLGYGIGKIESGPVAAGAIFSLIGLAMIVYGSWPVVSARWWHRD